MTIPYYEVLAFTDRLFSGNPAGVCLLEEKWLPDELMQQIAAENNLAETAFLIERENYFDLRWMTPAIEVDLCGHATLASGHVLFHHLGYKEDSIRFQSKSGELNVRREAERLVMNFPSQSLEPCATTPAKLVEGLRAEPTTVWKGRDYVAVFESEAEVAAITPDFKIVSELDAQGLVVTAPGNEVDFVSRYFVPRAGIPEDPVTGSTHCVLIPYWAKRLHKRELRARQISPRGGELFCEDRGARVLIGGQALTYSEGKLHTTTA
jgi:PhzF family phenazine biosynthesis protein